MIIDIDHGSSIAHILSIAGNPKHPYGISLICDTSINKGMTGQ